MPDAQEQRPSGQNGTPGTAPPAAPGSNDRPGGGASQIDDVQRSLAGAARGLSRAADVERSLAGAARGLSRAADVQRSLARAGRDLGRAAPALPTKSPFFGVETPQAAAARLRRILDGGTPSRTFTDEIVGLRSKRATKSEREHMRYGVAVVDPGGSPKLVGWGLDDMICIASMAKLAMLYAAFQLRADVETIVRSGLARTTGTPEELTKTAVQLVAKAFLKANDPALQDIGRTPEDMPVLERIFDMDGFLATGTSWPLRRLDFGTQGSGNGLDDTPFFDRLKAAMRVSDNNAATSCIADIGLPYIKALLTRTGLADVSGPGKGLWLATGFGYFKSRWPERKGRLVTSGTKGGERRCEKQGSAMGSGATAEGGTVRAIATFYELLRRGELVDSRSSMRMGEVLGGISDEFVWRYIASAVQLDQFVVEAWSKIGILKPWYHDSALITSEPPPRLKTGMPLVKTSRRTWIAVVLLSRGGANPITRMAREMARAVETT